MEALDIEVIAVDHVIYRDCRAANEEICMKTIVGGGGTSEIRQFGSRADNFDFRMG